MPRGSARRNKLILLQSNERPRVFKSVKFRGQSCHAGFCCAAVACPEIAQGASITKSAKQIPADFIVSNSAAGGRGAD